MRTFVRSISRACVRSGGFWAIVLSIATVGIAVPVTASINAPVTIAKSVVIKDQARHTPELAPVPVLYTRDDPWIVKEVKTISYRGDHYAKKPTIEADKSEQKRWEELRKKQKRSSVDPLEAYASAREYVAQTATPGGTMTRQGREKAVECLHPEFVMRLAAAIRDARENGMAGVGVFSACRPPAFGVGGFSDKFNSLHAYGLAVDMHGIGSAGSKQTIHWHQIAKRHGVVCPYGPSNRAEWNHCQPTNLKIITPANPLRKTITAKGPIDLERMWNTAKTLILDVSSGVIQVAKAPQVKKVKAKRRIVKHYRKKITRHAHVEKPLWPRGEG